MFFRRIILVLIRSEKTGNGVPVCGLELFFGSLLLFPRRILADGLVVQQIVQNVAHGIL
jgi:hypothetical protein